MHTTIAVQSSTLRMLKSIKDQYKVETLDEAIRKLILEKRKPLLSLYGAAKGIKGEFVREEIDRFD